MILIYITAVDAKPIPPLSDNAEEVIVQFTVKNLGYTIVPAIIDGADVYLAVPDIFDFLKIKFDAANDMSAVTGFFLDEKKDYKICVEPPFIQFGEQRFELGKTDVVRTETNIFLKNTLFGKVFGLNCNFNFRDLNVELKTDLDLPATALMRREKARTNLKNIFQPRTYDYYVGLKPSLVTPGMLDWSIASHAFTHDINYLDYSVDLGVEIAGGGLSTTMRHDTRREFAGGDVDWGWHFVNNDNRIFKQVNLGSVAVPHLLNVAEPFQGLSLKNESTLPRSNYSTHVIRDYTKPGWVVELYVKNQLVDFTRTDESGYYEFKIPVHYGATDIKLKFYGPWGEEEVKETHIEVPHVLLPPGDLDYGLTLARSEYSHFNLGFFSLQRGMTKNITSGLEFQQLDYAAPQPFRNVSAYTTMRAGNNLLVSGEAHSAGTYALQADFSANSGLAWQFKWRQQTLDDIFNKEDIAGEITTSLNIPHQLVHLPGRSLLSFGDVRYAADRRFRFAYNMSTSIGKIHPHLYSQWEWQGDNLARLAAGQTTLTVNIRLPFYLSLRPMVSYDHRFKSTNTLQVEVERHLLKSGWVSLNLSRDRQNNLTARFDLRYEFSLGRAGTAVKNYAGGSEFIQSVSGSFAYVGETRKFLPSKRKLLNSGGITIIPFLDLNNNDTFDPNEPRVPNLEVRTSGGRAIYAEEDTAIYVLDLPEHSRQYFEFSDRNFENIAWTPKWKSVAISVESHKFKTFYLPIVIRGEIAGQVIRKDADGEKGLSGIKILVEKTGGGFSETVLSSYDGYFGYMGLKPGHYKAYIDPAQLERLQLKCEPAVIEFEIKALEAGDFVENVYFVLQ